MIEYKVATASNTDALENQVADLIDLGFEPQGGVMVLAGRPEIWSQAMVRRAGAVAPKDEVAVLSME